MRVSSVGTIEEWKLLYFASVGASQGWPVPMAAAPAYQQNGPGESQLHHFQPPLVGTYKLWRYRRLETLVL